MKPSAALLNLTDRMTPATFKKVRRVLGFSQPALGAMLKVDDRTIRRWETGDVPIPGSVEVALAALLDGWRPKVSE